MNELRDNINFKNYDVTKYKPYKDYRGQCSFKSIKEKKMLWPTIEKNVIDDSYVIRPIKEQEIEEVVEIYRIGYPDLYGNTNNEIVYWSDTLYEYLQSKNGFMKGDKILIVEEKLDEKKLVGSMIAKKDDGNMSIYFEHAVIHPKYRSKKLFKELCKYCDELGEKAGAEYGFIMAATFHTITQKVFEELEWKVRGIFPGAIALWNYEDKYYRHSAVYYDKFYNKGHELVPKEMDITPIVESIKECLLKEE